MFKPEKKRTLEEDCTIEIPIKYAKFANMKGYCDGILKIEFWIPGLYNKYIKNMEYKQIDSMCKEIKAILKKYDEYIKTKEMTL